MRFVKHVAVFSLFLMAMSVPARADLPPLYEWAVEHR